MDGRMDRCIIGWMDGWMVGQTSGVAEHQNYAVLANFLMQLSQAGISIQKMDMVSNNNQIKLTATVQ